LPTPTPTPAPPTLPTPGPTPTPTPAPTPHTICATYDDFLPDTQRQGQCEFETVPTGENCWEQGCHPSGDQCYCYKQEPCESLGGRFEGPTCQSELSDWQTVAMLEVEVSGTCENVTTSWGSPLARNMNYLAGTCCANYPATVCNPEAKFVSPCKNDDDFMPDAFMFGWCDFFETPDQQPCEAAGCTFNNGSSWTSCSCDTQTTCEAADGRYDGRTCQSDSPYWDEAILRQAQELGSCVGLATFWSLSMEDWVTSDWGPARTCCKSFPATICEPDA